MIEAYKAGVPNNGQPFPDGSRIVKLQWKPKKSTEAPFVVDMPDVFTQAFVIEKDSKRFPRSGGWGKEEPMADVRKWIGELRPGKVVGRIVLKN